MAKRQTAVWLALAVALFTSIAVHAEGNIIWSSTGGPPGGSVNAIAVAPDAPGILFAGTNTGVFISRDDAANWSAVSNGLPDDRAVTTLALVDSKNLFAGTRNGIYRTRDAGVTWTLADARLADQFILALALDPHNPQIAYAGSLTTIWFTDNSGENWKDIGEGLRPMRVSAVASDSSAIYAATDAGIFFSRDRGKRWQPLADGLSEGARPQALAATAKGIFTGTTQGLFRLRDNRWSITGASFVDATIRLISADARNPERVFVATTKGLWRSGDSGDSWSAVPSIPGENSILSFAVGDRTSFYAGTARGMWKSSDDGNSWTALNAGMVSTSVTALLLQPENSNTLFAAMRSGLAVSADRGKSWREVSQLADANVLTLVADPMNSGIIYAGTLAGSIYISRDSGANFARLADSVSNSPISSFAIIPVANNARVLYAGTLGNGLYRSIDEGKTWNPFSANLPGVTRITALHFYPPLLYAGTDRGLYGLDHSKPNATWQIISAELPAEESRAIVRDPRNPQALLIAFISKGIFRSGEGGARWESIGKGAFPTRVRFQTLAIASKEISVIYVGTDRGIYRSDDDGATWAASNEGLPPGAEIESIAIDPADPRRVFVGTDGYGVLAGTEETHPTGIAWQIPAAIAGAIVIALGALAFVWQTYLSPRTQERAWADEWPAWDNAIHHALWTFGQANRVNLNHLPPRRLFRALQHYKELHPDDALTLSLPPRTALQMDNYLPAQKFLSLWKAAQEVTENAEPFLSITNEMMDGMCLMLGFARVEQRTFFGIVGYVVKAPALRLRIPPRFPIIFIPQNETGAEQVGALRELMNTLKMTSYFALIVDLRDSPPRSQPSLKRTLRQTMHDFVVLDGADLRRLLSAKDPSRRFVEIILDQVDLNTVSPYITSGPVPENMFFGRDNELKTIIRTLREQNYAIVGGRKIGKTSLLARVNNILQGIPDFQPFYMDCEVVQTNTDFFQAVNTLWAMHLPAETTEGFRLAAMDLGSQYPGKMVVLLFDEIDALLQYDIEHGEQLFSVCRALAQENRVRFIFCGDKVLRTSLHNPDLAFFDFCRLINLSYLSEAEARRVVSEPMEEMGITLEYGATLVQAIVRQSAQHPNLIQYLCQELIKRISLRGERVIRRADLIAFVKSNQFAEYFLDVCWGKSTALERLIAVLLLDKPETSVAEITVAVRRLDLNLQPEELDKALEGLRLNSILQKDGSKYVFPTEVFPDILRRTQDLSALRERLLLEVKAEGGNSPRM